ncbi:methyltransferase [Phaeobacter porticola]|uniref:Putative biotin synthesis protein BioC n=1 Tax=Phaeobacter porticola TaxID=1844006 RepID=A0A1L3I2H6_9RHOB|nr:methyltransferase [Phaeobacter porticola]APG46313.1 putative biotin synthesis protein BioC [Phaeobacter porticola]
MKDLTVGTSDCNRVANSFRRGLGSYHAQATAQARVAVDLADLLQKCVGDRRFAHVFEFGAGTGHLTEALFHRFDIGTIALNDLVAEAEPPLQQTVAAHGGKASFAVGPIETCAFPQGVDLIAASSVVQWVPNVPQLMQRCAAALTPNGWLALSGYGRGHFRELAALGSTAAAPNYMDHSDWPAVLPQDLQLVELRQAAITLHFASPRDVLRHLRETGVNGQSQGGWTRARLVGFEAAYRQRFSTPQGVTLTYDPVLILARRR